MTLFLLGALFGVLVSVVAVKFGEWRVRRAWARRGGDISEAIREARR